LFSLPPTDAGPSAQERWLRLLCEKYWRKGDEGRNEIYKQCVCAVPCLESDGVDVGDGATDIGEEVTYVHIDLGPGFERFFDGYDTILLRREYPDVLSHIQKIQEGKMGGAVVTGQPGIGQLSRSLLNNSDNSNIGKSIFLYYALIERVLNGEPTLFQLGPKSAFMLLGQTNVRIFREDDDIDTQEYPGAWALVDSNAAIKAPRGELAMANSRIFLVQATSPQPSRWSEWAKQRRAPLVVMDPFSWHEFYIGGFVMPFLSCILVFMSFTGSTLNLLVSTQIFCERFSPYTGGQLAIATTLHEIRACYKIWRTPSQIAFKIYQI
jgi:hypothetical protein